MAMNDLAVRMEALDLLLFDVCDNLQLSPTHHQKAEDRYHSIAKVISGANSPFKFWDSNIYSQGSMRLRTTVKPINTPHDLDLVCELDVAHADVDPMGPDDDETVWKILRRFHILVFNFTAADSASAELMHERALRALDSEGIDEARNLWSRLTELALQIAVNAGHRTRESLIADLASFRLAPSRNNRKALASIAEESQSALSDINDEVS